jgi:hypothetical protein
MGSTSIRLASVDEVLSARAYMCFVSPHLRSKSWVYKVVVADKQYERVTN